jgi:hypothetical protein
LNARSESQEDVLEASLIDIVVESWRLTRSFTRLLTKLDASEAVRYQSQLRFYLKRLDGALASAGLKIADLEGQPYDAGMAATPLNIADFAPDDVLLVDQMLEPVIMGDSGLRRTGTIMLKRLPT